MSRPRAAVRRSSAARRTTTSTRKFWSERPLASLADGPGVPGSRRSASGARRRWDDDALRHEADPAAELEAHLVRIGSVIAAEDYRGCPQLNAAIEFPAPGHPARAVALAHKLALRDRLRWITARLGVRSPHDLADQLALVIDGAFVDGQLLGRTQAAATLIGTARALVVAARADAAG